MNTLAKRNLLLLIMAGCLFACKEDEPVTDQNVYHEDGEVQVLFENDPEGVNIIFLSDGFTQLGLQVDGGYERSGTKVIDYLFGVLPFSTYRQYFNAYIVYAKSAEGLTTDKALKRNTVFGTTWDRSLDRRLLTNTSTCFEYASRAVGGDLSKVHIVVLLANVDLYGGAAYDRIALTAQQYKEDVIVHEIGHAFANLADEYVDSGTGLDPTWFVENSANVDDDNDLDRIKWSHFIGREGYEAVGAYEGGSYISKGIWRPEDTSIMNNILLKHFNAPSREAIVKRIFEIKGTPYELDEFLANDVIPASFSSRIHHRDAKVLFDCQRP